jgi:GNAT superfamily N-acetyltransferase
MKEYTPSVDEKRSPERGGSDKLTGGLGNKLEKLTSAMQGREVTPRTRSAEQIAQRAPTIDAERDRSVHAERPLPPAHGEHQDVQISDKEGKPLVLCTEQGSRETLKQALRRTDTQNVRHPVRLNVYRQGQEAGYARLTLEVDKKYNTATDRYDQFSDVRMRLNDVNVPESERRRGVGSQLLDRAEEAARAGEAREIYGVLESESARPFYEARGYSFRRNAENRTEVFKTFYWGPDRR